MSRTTIRWTALIAATSIAVAPVFPASAAHRRLPPDYHWGRCLLEIDGKTYISGRCSYSIGPGASFEINGPHQIWDGIDYPKTDLFPLQRSADYFAQVDIEGDHAEGFWNEDKRATHAQSHFGSLIRKGACWVSETARVCLWKR